MTLNERVRAIATKKDLVAFIRALRTDLLRNPQDWDNDSLERYLEGMAAWTDVMENFFRNESREMEAEPKWRLFGEMLFAATMYE